MIWLILILAVPITPTSGKFEVHKIKRYESMKACEAQIKTMTEEARWMFACEVIK